MLHWVIWALENVVYSFLSGLLKHQLAPVQWALWSDMIATLWRLISASRRFFSSVLDNAWRRHHSGGTALDLEDPPLLLVAVWRICRRGTVVCFSDFVSSGQPGRECWWDPSDNDTRQRRTGTWDKCSENSGLVWSSNLGSVFLSDSTRYIKMYYEW